MKKSILIKVKTIAFALAVGLSVVGTEGLTSAVAATATGNQKIIIDETTFPDINFRIMVENYDVNVDGRLSSLELEACTVMELSCMDINSLEGIEYLTSLETLYCDGNNLTSLDLSKNTKLKTLYCNDNKLTRLDVSSKSNLETLDCSENKLISVNVSGDKKLKSLTCSNNSLEDLDLSGLNSLTYLDISDNYMNDFDPGKATSLQYLKCKNNGISSLDVSKLEDLIGLECSNNYLKNLDVSKNTELSELVCEENKLTDIDLANNKELTNLDCSNNRLTALDLSENKKLTNLDCSSNRLTALDLSENEYLEELVCNANNLNNLDVSNNIYLTVLECGGCGLTSLDISKNTELTKVDCYENSMDALDITANLKIKEVFANGRVTGNITSPTISKVENQSTGVKVTWGKISGVSGYSVYRKTATGEWTFVKNVSTTSYVDTSVSKNSGTTYIYSVSAYKYLETIIYSKFDEKGKSIKRISQVTLQAPENTAKGVKVKWSKVTGASGYIVYRKSSAEKNWTKIAQVQGNAKVSYLDTKAKTNGAKYAYTVKAYSGTVTGSANQTGKALYYVAPTGLTSLKNAASKSVTVKWKKNAKATGYQVQYSTSAKFTGAKTVTVKGSASVTKTLSKLTKGKTYYVRVRSYKKGASANYFSAWSAAKKVKVSK